MAVEFSEDEMFTLKGGVGEYNVTMRNGISKTVN
jgi:hypothetical protein